MVFLSSDQSPWNTEEEVRSTISAPGGQEAPLRLQCNGVSGSGPETSSSSAPVLLRLQSTHPFTAPV